MTDVQLEPAGATPAPRASGSMAWKVLTVLLAVACAVLAFLLLRPAEEAEAEGGVTANGESSAALACQVLGEVTAIPDEDLGGDEAAVEQTRLSAANVLSMLAAEQDASYDEFKDTLRAPAEVMARTFSLDSPEFHEAMDTASSACADRFPPED